MAAPKGNKNGEKYKTGKERRELCIAFMKHVENGYTDDCFPECDIKTIKRMVSTYPIEFPSDQIARSRRIGYLQDQKLLRAGMCGKINKFNSSSNQFWMLNKHGWKLNRVDITSDDKPIKTQVIVIGGKEIEF